MDDRTDLPRTENISNSAGWWQDDDGYIWVRCPGCLGLGKLHHDVDEQGRVDPSVGCSNPDCDFHEWVRLVGWDEEPAEVIDLSEHRCAAGDVPAAELSPEFSRYIDAHEQLLEAIKVYQEAALALEAADPPTLTTEDSPVDIELRPEEIVHKGRLRLIHLLSMTIEDDEE